MKAAGCSPLFEASLSSSYLVYPSILPLFLFSSLSAPGPLRTSRPSTARITALTMPTFTLLVMWTSGKQKR